jgi:HD-GYP domain-containing protein (c-di-GMP phosphodiesterase class II)
MSNSVAPPEVDGGPPPDAVDRNTVTVPVDSLIVGRTLKSPIIDANGILLVAAGSQITAQVKRRLKDRKLSRIEMDANDAISAVFRPEGIGDAATRFTLDNELIQRLDEMIRSEGLFVANAGPAVREGMVLHGCRGYDQEHRNRLLSQHEETASALDEMMQGALHGKSINSNEIASIAAAYLTELSADSDSVLSVAAEAGRDKQLSQHCLDMSLMGMAIAIENGMDAANVRTVGICGLLHDWGMTRVDPGLRESAHALSPIQYLDIQKHPIHSLEMLKGLEGVPAIVPLICFQVHERLNGKGYPRGRMEGSIHPFAQILNIADAYVTMTSPQPYRGPLMPYSAMECLIKMSHDKYVSPQLVRCLLRMLSLFPIGSLVSLSDGSLAQVVRRNAGDYTKPVVEVLQNASGKAVGDDYEQLIDLGASDLEVAEVFANPKCNQIELTEDEFRYQCRR